MKYVIFKHKSGAIMPVIVLDIVTHALVTIPDAVPVSAGFLKITIKKDAGIWVRVLPGLSESLGIGPAPGDEMYLQAVVENLGAYAFIDC